MPLQIGSQAPDFTLTTATAAGPRAVTLSENFGHASTVLLFFPMVFTSVCTQEMCSVSQNIARYASLGANVYGISGDNPFAQEAWAQKEGIEFPLLSDYEHRVASLYQVAYETFLPQLGLPMGGVAKRAAFLVDKSGAIQHAEVLEDARELPDFDALVARLSALA